MATRGGTTEYVICYLLLQIAMVFCTSRGRDLHLHLKLKEEAVVFHWSGGKTDQIKQEAIQKIKYYKKKYRTIHAYFLVGIPDITHRVKENDYEEVTMVEDIEKLAKDIKKKFLDLAQETKEIGSQVCICTVPPMDLEKWNQHRLDKKKTKKLVHKQNYPKMQNTLEDVIIEINKLIVEININNNMITPFICDTIMFKTGSSLKRKYQKFPDGLHPGTQAYQEWGKILANRIDTNFSRSVGEDGACKPDFPPKTPTPRPVEEHSSSPDGKRKRHWKTYWMLQNLGFKSKSLSLRRVLPWGAHVGGGPPPRRGTPTEGPGYRLTPLCHLQGTTLARPMGSPRSEKGLLLGRGPQRAAISGPSPLSYHPEYNITVNSTQWVFCSLPPLKAFEIHKK